MVGRMDRLDKTMFIKSARMPPINAAMSQTRSSLAVFVFDGCVYAAGGYGASGLSTVEKYEPAFDRWSTVRSMGSARRAFKAVALTVEENVFDAMMRRALQ